MIIEKIAIVSAAGLCTLAQAAPAAASSAFSEIGPWANATAMGLLAAVLWSVFDSHKEERKALMGLLNSLGEQIGKLADQLRSTNDNCAKHGAMLGSLLGKPIRPHREEDNL